MPRWKILKKSDQSIVAQSVTGDDARSAMFSLGLDDDQQLLHDAVMVNPNPPATVFTVCSGHPERAGRVIEIMATGSRERAIEERGRGGGMVVVEESEEVNKVIAKERRA